MKRFLVLLVLTLLPAALPAQSTSPETEGARAAVLGYLHAAREGDWTRQASFVHPESLREFRANVEGAVAADSSGTMLRLLLGLETPAELEAMLDSEVYALFFRRQLGTAEMRAEMAGTEFEVTAAALEGPGSARVEYLTRRGGQSVPGTPLQLRRVEDGRWLILFRSRPASEP